MLNAIRLDVRDLKAWELEKTFIAKRMVKGPAQGVGGGNVKTPMKKG